MVHGKVTQTKSNRWPYVIGPLLLLFLIAVIKSGLGRVEHEVRRHTIDSLKTILNTSHDTISRIWLDNLYFDAGEVITDEVVRNVKSLELAGPDVVKKKNHPAQELLKQYFKKYMTHLGGMGVDVIAPDYTSLTSMDHKQIGKKHIIATHYPVTLARVFAGIPQFVPPIHDEHYEDEDHRSVDDSHVSMFYMVPIRDSRQIVFAALAVRMNPNQTINSIAWSGRLGETGETIVFDKHARLVTESRFHNQLMKAGYLKDGQSSIHNIELRDLTLESVKGSVHDETSTQSHLGLMARSAISGQSGDSMGGYRNYRGVPVLSAWLWDDQLGIGMATEIAEYEALEPYRKTQAIVLTMLALAVLSIIGFVYFIRMLRKKNQAEVEESEAYLRVVLENAADGIITIDDTGIIQTFNLAAEQLFQYSRDEALGRNVDIIVPESHKEQHASYISNHQRTGHTRLVGARTNLEGLRKDGSTFPASIGLSKITLGDKNIFVAIVRDLTQEKETEQKLQRYQEDLASLVEERTSALMESEALNRQILESAGEGIYGLNIKGETVFVNRAAASMLGYEPEDLIGEPMHSLIHHSHADGSPYHREQCPMYAAFMDGATHHVSDEVLWRKDGSSFPADYTSKPIYNNGEIIGAVVTFSDMTERLKAEEQLRNLNSELENRVNQRTAELHRSQTVLNRAQHIAHLGSWNWDIVSGALAWSDEIYRIFGLSPQQFEATYQAFVETIHRDDRDAVTRAVNASVTDPDIPYDIEHRVVLPDGEIRYVREQGEIERDVSGSPLYMIGIVHDITEQKKAQHAIDQAMQDIATNERVLRLALSAAGAGYFHFDVQTGALFWDERSFAIYGITGRDFGGQFEDWAKRVHEDDLDNASKSFTQALQNSTTSSFMLDYRIRRLDREITYIHVTGYVERDETGQATAVHGLHFDVTESKFTEQNLLEAIEAAEMANRTKSEFLAVMSHEIRTPMNAIIGMSNLVLNTELKPKQQSYLNKVVSSAESLLHIINDILDFSKIEAGQLSLETIDFQLDEVLDKLTHLVVLKAQEKGLEFLFSIGKTIPQRLLGDPTRLLQVLVNLTSNAVKFTEHGEVVLSVELVAEKDQQVELRFTVRDTGIGIEPDKQQRMFKSFSQADASITRKYGGTGLGLVIVKRMVNLMGGDISFESEPGVGSSFHFNITFGRGQQITRVDHALPGDMADLRVLVVDDSESARTILGETLEGFGFKVDTAATCNEAISAVETAEQRGNPYRLVLMDWKMPGQSGVDGARVILGQTKSPAPPVVMMVTAYNAEDLATEIQGLAISNTLVKPISPSSLLDAILSAFRHEEQKQLAISGQGAVRVKPATRLAGARVLVVEDNELNMELALELLHDVGIRTGSAANGQQALECLEQEQFDGILMDVHMPVMDGLEATRIIRRNAQYQSLPIIALTADALASDREDILATGMNDVIVKPIKVEVMLETMAKWIRPAASHQLLPATDVKQKEIVMHLSIPGIDTRAGLETCNGKLSLYKKLLKKFIDEVEFIEHFTAAMAMGDHETAERLAHTLKGTAGNIGANGIQQAAKELQDAIKKKAGKKQIKELYKKLEQELMPVIQSLGKADLSDKTASEPVNHPLDRTKLLSELDALAVLLADDDTDATDRIDKISIGLENSFYADDIGKIAKHVNRYEFKVALDCLNRLTEKLRAA